MRAWISKRILGFNIGISAPVAAPAPRIPHPAPAVPAELVANIAGLQRAGDALVAANGALIDEKHEIVALLREATDYIDAIAEKAGVGNDAAVQLVRRCRALMAKVAA
jgi:hypothetical protein